MFIPSAIFLIIDGDNYYFSDDRDGVSELLWGDCELNIIGVSVENY